MAEKNGSNDIAEILRLLRQSVDADRARFEAENEDDPEAEDAEDEVEEESEDEITEDEGEEE